MSFLSRIIPRGCAYFSRPILSCAKARQASTWPLASNIQSSIPTSTRMSFQGSKREFSLASSPIQSNQGSTMHKTKKIGLYLLVGTLLATSLGLYATENKNTALSKQLQPVILSEVQGTAWVQKCVEQYPEILWLADAKVRKTEEGLATMQGPYSEQLFGQKFIEFDRTIMTLHCLQLILDGSENAYQKFTAAQPGDAKLSRESFAKLHSQGVALIKSNYNRMSELEMTQAMEAALVLGDIGKSEQARAVFKPYGAVAPDHDDFHGEVMQILEQHPNLCPTFDKLTPSAKRLLQSTANLAHYGHVTQ